MSFWSLQIDQKTVKCYFYLLFIYFRLTHRSYFSWPNLNFHWTEKNAYKLSFLVWTTVSLKKLNVPPTHGKIDIQSKSFFENSVWKINPTPKKLFPLCNLAGNLLYLFYLLLSSNQKKNSCAILATKNTNY